MRSVSAAFEYALASDTLQLAELYVMELSDGTIYRYTTHQTDLVWDLAGNTYSAAMPMERSEMSTKHSGEFDDIQIALGNIDGPFYNKVRRGILDNVKVTIKRIRWDTSYAADEEITVFEGFADVTYNRRVLNLTCRPILSSLNVLVPAHQYQDACNYALFDEGCTLLRANYAYAGTATGGSYSTLEDSTRGAVYKVNFDAVSGVVARGETITGTGAGTGVVVQIVYLTASTGTVWYVRQTGTQFVDNEVVSHGAHNVTLSGTPAVDATFYQLGELEITSGDNNGQRRQVYADASGALTLAWGFAMQILPGVTYNLYPGCDRTATTCRDKFNNKDNWRGFSYIPTTDEVIGENWQYLI